jgi:hypothetical protein
MRRIAYFRCAIFLATLGTQPAVAQGGKSPDYPGETLVTPSVSSDSARKVCLVLGTNKSPTDVKRSGSCVAHGCSVAGRTPKDDWTTCSYEAHWIVPASASDPLDTVAENEVVLYRSQPKRRGARLTPVWHEVYEPEIQRSVMPSVTRVQPGTDLLAIQECLNGTGGCGESFLIDRGTGWRPVRLTFLDSVERRYPSGIRHGFHVDPRTLTAVTQIYSDTDPNCCPSRSAVIQLQLKGDTLGMKSIRVKHQ